MILLRIQQGSHLPKKNVVFPVNRCFGARNLIWQSPLTKGWNIGYTALGGRIKKNI